MISNGTIKDRALSMTGASEAIMAYLTKLGVTSAAELTFAQRLNLTVIALKEQAAAFLKSPFGKAVIIAAAIFAVVKLAQHLANAAERAAEKLSEISDELSSLMSEIDSVNSALESTKQRIAELQAKGPLTFTEEAELTRLQKANAELERKLELLEANRAAGNAKFEKTFIDAFNSQYGDKRSFTASGKKDWTDWLYNALSDDNIKTYTGAEYIELQFSQYAKAMRGGKAYTNHLEVYKSNLGEVFNDYQEYLKQLETAMYKYGANAQIDAYIDQINEFNDRYLIAFGDAQNLFMQIISRDKFAEAYDAIKQLGNITGESLLALYNSNSNVKELVDYLMGLGQIDWKTILGDDEFARLDTNSDGALTRIELFDQVTGECKVSSEQWAKAMGGIVTQMQSLASNTKVATKDVKDFKAVLSGINSLASGLDQLDSIYADIYDKEDFDWSSILGNEDFTNAFGGLGDAYDDFIKTVANAPDDISACQSAFDKLATAYIVNSGALKDVTDDTRDATVAMIEQMGVANAAALVDEQLALNKETLRLQSELQSDATHQDVLALFDEETAARITAQAIYELAIAKIQTNESAIVTASDIDQLEGLAKSANATEASLLRLAQAKQLMAQSESLSASAKAKYEAEGDSRSYQLMVSRAQQYAKRAEELLNQQLEYNEVDFDKYKSAVYTGGSATNSAKNSAKNRSSKSDKETWFEQQYKMHQHLVAMEQETDEEYFKWLNGAYQQAYSEGIIELDEYRKYQEEVFNGIRTLFMDSLADIEHEISMRSNYDGEAKKIIQLYEGLIADVEKEIAAARARGLTDEDDYIQELQKKWQDYTGSIKDLREDITDASKAALDELIDYRIDMLKQEIEDEKDALDKRLDNLREFYDKQKEMLQDQRDEENYLKDQSDKRKTVTDLQAELAMLANDDSAWAQKRKLELQEKLVTAQEDLDEFEKDHALDLALDAIDKAYNDQESQLQAEMDALDERLNDPEALFNKALEDIRKNSENQLYYQMLMYNRQFGDGNDETVVELWESAYGTLTDYEKLFGELYKGVKLENETGVKADGGWDKEVISGTNPNNQKPSQSTTTAKPSKTESENKAPALTKGSSVQVKSSATHFGSKSGGVRMAKSVPGGTYTVYETNGGQVLIGRKGVYTGWINKSDIVGYRSGTNYSIGGLAQFDEEGDGSEYIFESSDGNRYRMFAEGSKVLNAKAADFLYNFATTGGDFLTKTLADLLGLSGLGNIAKPVQAIEIHSGDVIVQGNATERTVSAIRRAQRDNLEFVLKELNRLNK